MNREIGVVTWLQWMASDIGIVLSYLARAGLSSISLIILFAELAVWVFRKIYWQSWVFWVFHVIPDTELKNRKMTVSRQCSKHRKL